MRTLSIMQPFASLLGEQVKIFELRSWNTSYRGPLLVRASRNSPIHWQNDGNNRVRLPTCCHLFVGELVDVRPMQPADRIGAMSIYWNEDYCWEIRFSHYVYTTPAAGKLKLYQTPDDQIQRLPEAEIRKFHPELKSRTRHPFQATVVDGQLIVTDGRTGEMPYYTLHDGKTPLMSYVIVPLYGYVGGARGGDTPIPWQEVADSINQGVAYQRVEDLPARQVKTQQRRRQSHDNQNNHTAP